MVVILLEMFELEFDEIMIEEFLEVVRGERRGFKVVIWFKKWKFC